MKSQNSNTGSASFNLGGSVNAKDVEQLKNNFKYQSLAREVLLAEVLPDNMAAIYMKRDDGSIYRLNYLRRSNGRDEDFLVPGFVIVAEGLLSKYGLSAPEKGWKFEPCDVSREAINAILDREDKEFIKALDAAVFHPSQRARVEDWSDTVYKVDHEQDYHNLKQVEDNAKLTGEYIRLYLCGEEAYDKLYKDLDEYWVNGDPATLMRKCKHIEPNVFYTVPRKSATGALPIFLELGFYDVEDIIKYYPAQGQRIKYAQDNGGMLMEEIGIAICGPKHIFKYRMH